VLCVINRISSPTIIPLSVLRGVSERNGRYRNLQADDAVFDGALRASILWGMVVVDWWWWWW
jgi:hypothetical protein